MNRRQTIPKEQKYTVSDFERDFPDDDACLKTIMQWRRPQRKETESRFQNGSGERSTRLSKMLFRCCKWSDFLCQMKCPRR